jgi:hypothetical protein
LQELAACDEEILDAWSVFPDVLVVIAHKCINTINDAKSERLVSHPLQDRCQEMSHIKYLKCSCQHCGGHIEFPADAIGTNVQCPHCAAQTDLYLPEPPDSGSGSKKPLVIAIAGLLIVVLGLGAAFSALNTAKRLARKRQEAAIAAAAPAATPAQAAPPPSKDGLSPSGVALEKTPGSSLVYAVGTVTNDTNRRRFGLKIEIELLDAAGKPTGTAKDYIKVLDENGEWHFRAMVMDGKAASGRISAIQEDK